ncbi:response regulator transcription factor [bacterium]|nr:response regulator transcription factor [bacterium]
MNLNCIQNENIKYTFLDDTNTNVKDNCFIEIIIKKSMFKKANKLAKKPVTSAGCFTEREIKVLEYLAEGMNNTEISQAMNVSIHTIKMHIHGILSKLSVQRRTQAVVKAIKQKLIKI